MPNVTSTPRGEYPGPAPLHYLDLAAEADRLLGELPGQERRGRTVAREGGVSLVMIAMEAGDLLREHSTPGTTTVQVLRGQAALSAEGQVVELAPGGLVMMQPGVRHDLRAAQQSVVLLTVAGGEG